MTSCEPTHCLECQRLRRKLNELETKYIIQANMWLMLKRFILEQEKGNGDPGNGQGEKP
jgi:hypothetical protein